MARTIKSGKELSWHKGTKRWYKTHNGKPYYFGSGTSERDRRSYEVAVRKYHAWLDEREKTEKAAGVIQLIPELMQLLRQVEYGKQPVAALEQPRYGNLGKIVAKDIRDKWRIDDKGYTTLEGIEFGPLSMQPLIDAALGEVEAAGPATQADKPGKKRSNINGHIEAWLAEEQTRVDAGQLTATAQRDKTNGIATLREFCGTQSFGKPEDVDQLCLDYRQWLMRKVAAGDYSANTVNDKTKFAGQFIEYCWQRAVIKQLPRTLKELRKKLHTEKKGKPIKLTDLHKIWHAAGPRMKCFIAIGLNGGMKNGDISALKGSNLQGDRLVGKREKTKKSNVPYNYKLWPLTQKLIKDQRDRTGDDELLFVNKKGGRITTDSFSRLFKRVANKAGVEATFEQLRDTAAEYVKQELFKQGGEMGPLQIFLAHKDKSTAKYYVSDDEAHLVVPKLDKIVMGMQKTFGLK